MGGRITRRAWVLLAFGLLTAGGRAMAQQGSPPRLFDAVGRWRFFHTDGKPFHVRLAPDQTADSDFATGEQGIWRWEGKAVRIMFTDGWDDVLSMGPDGRFTHAGWAPDTDRCGPSSNRGAGEKVSDDPGPRL